MASTLEWLRELDDAELVALLAARPDLAMPAPTDLNTLAGRLNSSPSVWRAAETVSRFGLELLTGLVVLGADRREVDPGELTELYGQSTTVDQITAELERLRALALVRGRRLLQVPHAVVDIVGQHPAGLGAAAGLDPDQVATELAQSPEPEVKLLRLLADGPPLGEASPTSAAGKLVPGLIGRGLLIRRDQDIVELPREVALQLRGDSPLGAGHPTPPALEMTDPGVRTADRTGAGQALELLRDARRVIASFSTTAVAALKSGGIGVRESRRLVKELGLTETTVHLIVEVLAAANLIAPTAARTRLGEVWAPTDNADTWLAAPDEAAWTVLVEHWLDLRREPARVGRVDNASGKTANLLSFELGWLRGPMDRRWVLRALAELPTGRGLQPVALKELMSWRSPLRSADRRDQVIDQVIGEATTLGVVAFDALTNAGRALLSGDGNPAGLLAEALPDQARSVLIQADLTIVAPGRLEPDLARELAVVADVESSGSATVYRVSPSTIRRALDRGRSAGELEHLFAAHSATPVPQALTYLIHDVARRHGALRTGLTSAYLRCDDPVLIDQAIAAVAAVGIVLRRLAPTVAVTGTDADELLAALRNAGFAPVAEDEFGAALTVPAHPPRVRPGLVTHQRWREPATPSTDQLAALVSRLRGAADTGSGPQSSAQVIAELRTAIRTRSAVWIDYVNQEGSASPRLIEPIALSGGSVAAMDRLSGQVRTFVLYRITAIGTAVGVTTGDLQSPADSSSQQAGDG